MRGLNATHLICTLSPNFPTGLSVQIMVDHEMEILMTTRSEFTHSG